MEKQAKKTKVAVAMSGGVDSSVAAFLLQKKGYEVFGLHMRLGSGGKEQMAEAAARRVCQELDIKFYALNIASKFKKEVIEYFLDSYQKGLTPNPCVRCNQKIKFGELLKRAKELGADKLATGHYIASRITHNAYRKKDEYKLCKGKDADKDQSYFLWHLTQEQLRDILFPLGSYTKDRIKEIAGKAGLPNIKSESQDICFLPGDHNDLLRKKLKLKPGDIRTLDGKLIGQHQGLPLYTIGQRKGVEIGGTGPYYVAGFDYPKNILYVVNGVDDSSLFKSELKIREVNWISGQFPKLPFRCEAVIRYRHKAVACAVDKDLQVIFSKPQRAVTPGQSIVFYKGNKVLGGGIIV